MLRRIVRSGLQSSTRLKRSIITIYELERPPFKPNDQDNPKWAQFFLSQPPNIEFDVDRTLLNDQQGEADEYAVRYILTNYKKLKSYQLLRSLLFIKSFFYKAKIISQLRKNIIDKDIEVFPADLEVIARLNLIFFYEDPLLIEFCVYNISKFFQKQDLIGKVYSMSYLLLVSKVSEDLVRDYLNELAPLYSGKEVEFQSEFENWTTDLKFSFIITLQILETILKKDEHQKVIKGLLNRLLPRVFYHLTRFSRSLPKKKS